MATTPLAPLPVDGETTDGTENHGAEWIVVLLRYGSALLLLMYGFAKINGSQFTILDSELDKPMGQVSGFWLSWYYFGYSPWYGNFIATAQVVGAMLLTFRRTALLGACVLAPMLLNITLINFAYRIALDAAVIALLLFLAMLLLIARSWRELLAVFWPAHSGRSGSFGLEWTRWGVRLLMVCIAFSFTYWVANYNNRHPTPLDGV